MARMPQDRVCLSRAPATAPVLRLSMPATMSVALRSRAACLRTTVVIASGFGLRLEGTRGDAHPEASKARLKPQSCRWGGGWSTDGVDELVDVIASQESCRRFFAGFEPRPEVTVQVFVRCTLHEFLEHCEVNGFIAILPQKSSNSGIEGVVADEPVQHIECVKTFCVAQRSELQATEVRNPAHHPVWMVLGLFTKPLQGDRGLLLKSIVALQRLPA